jgi:hypothetical protein
MDAAHSERLASSRSAEEIEISHRMEAYPSMNLLWHCSCWVGAGPLTIAVALALTAQASADDTWIPLGGVGAAAVATGVGVVLFRPALFFIKGDSTTAAEVARLKGEMDPIEQASIQKKCGIEFRRA